MAKKLKTKNSGEGAEHKRERIRFILYIVFGSITALAALVGIYIAIKQNCLLGCKPRFEYIFEGAFDQNRPEYEVAFPLGWAENNQVPSAIRIIINAQYKGNDIKGPAYIKIQPADLSLPPILVGEWADFSVDSNQQIAISLSFRNLFDYAGLSANPVNPDLSLQDPWAGNKGTFEIYIEHGGEKRDTKDITVLNTPWFHQTYLSNYEFRLGQAPQIITTVVNYGATSEFEVNSCFYKISSPSFTIDFESFTSSPDGWWPEKSLDKICIEYQTTTVQVSKGESETIVQQINADSIIESGVYTVVTFVIKRIPVIEYDPSRQWTDDDNIGLVRDGRHYETFFVLR